MNTDNNPGILIREALPKDHPVIVSFQLAMALETENLKLNRARVEKGVRAALDDPSRGRYFVAESGGQVIASMMITYEWSDWRNGTVWWIQSVYILPAFRGKKIFTAMYNSLKERVMADDHVLGLRLYVDQTNQHARRVYAALGMNGEHYTTYEWMK